MLVRSSQGSSGEQRLNEQHCTYPAFLSLELESIKSDGGGRFDFGIFIDAALPCRILKCNREQVFECAGSCLASGSGQPDARSDE
jgi:hypothetical protein